MADSPVNVGLFVTCLVDLFRPSVGFATVKLLEDAGCIVHVPDTQTCCGQPAYNSGSRNDAKDLGRNVIAAFQDFDYVVAPSGSCAAMIREHYPRLFADDPAMADKAKRVADKTFELTSFLADVRKVTSVGAKFNAVAAYHDSCSGLRELGVREQPRYLLASVEGLEVKDLEKGDACCGFGGTFCVKYPEISDEMVTRKTSDITATGADTVLAGDLGCLMNIAGKLKRDGSNIAVRHVAEVLAGDDGTPPIAGGER